jgi:hypothetical protein
MEEVKMWQGRPLDAVYPIIYLDALVVKIRDTGHVRNRAIYVAIGVNLKGNKEVLGLWTNEAEGARLWLQVLTDMKNRGVADIFIACVDGLTGFPEAIETVFPQAQVQLCIVHQVRASLNYVSWKQRKTVAADLQTVYRANTADDAYVKLEAFAEKWDGTYPTIRQMGRRNWEHLTPFFGYPANIRNVQCRRVSEHVAAQGNQDEGVVSQCGCSDEVAVPGAGAHCPEVDDAGAELEASLAPFRDIAGRPSPGRRAGVSRKEKIRTKEHSLRPRLPGAGRTVSCPPGNRAQLRDKFFSQSNTNSKTK